MLLVDFVSVDAVPWLPLRLRFQYFSMASASLSRMRLTMVTGLGGAVNEPFEVPGVEYVVELVGT